MKEKININTYIYIYNLTIIKPKKNQLQNKL